MPPLYLSCENHQLVIATACDEHQDALSAYVYDRFDVLDYHLVPTVVSEVWRRALGLLHEADSLLLDAELLQKIARSVIRERTCAAQHEGAYVTRTPETVNGLLTAA